MYFVLFIVAIALNPVLAPISLALIWLFVVGSVGYLIFSKEKPEGHPRADTVIGIFVLVLCLPPLIAEIWQDLGVKVPYSFILSLAKYGFLRIAG
ncbi:hypothetical protein LMG26842_05789 [Achromobacter dolens]|uniref:hypothetical protein n=1 Tax=Achromobacter dolens TaxID=1287738 RepID=UPI001469942F|nr:hypothetical protein [Achromobacter dolens]CAB3909490.1 hypothetical protein LMG26842_05789 [Achromobacter dolens]